MRGDPDSKEENHSADDSYGSDDFDEDLMDEEGGDARKEPASQNGFELSSASKEEEETYSTVATAEGSRAANRLNHSEGECIEINDGPRSQTLENRLSKNEEDRLDGAASDRQQRDTREEGCSRGESVKHEDRQSGKGRTPTPSQEEEDSDSATYSSQGFASSTEEKGGQLSNSEAAEHLNPLSAPSRESEECGSPASPVSPKHVEHGIDPAKVREDTSESGQGNVRQQDAISLPEFNNATEEYQDGTPPEHLTLEGIGIIREALGTGSSNYAHTWETTSEHFVSTSSLSMFMPAPGELTLHLYAPPLPQRPGSGDESARLPVVTSKVLESPSARRERHLIKMQEQMHEGVVSLKQIRACLIVQKWVHVCLIR